MPKEETLSKLIGHDETFDGFAFGNQLFTSPNCGLVRVVSGKDGNHQFGDFAWQVGMAILEISYDRSVPRGGPSCSGQNCLWI